MMITQKSKPHTFVIPIFKDNKTYLYYTNRTVGQPPLVVKLVVELGGSALFFQCDRISYNSTTYTHVLSPKLAVRTRLTCVDVFEDSGWSDLPNGGNSILGLADSSMSFVKSLESSYKIPFKTKIVTCLAFVDARNDPRFPIEIGGYQMDNHLVEFDFEASTFSFTSSLLRHNASCSRM
ncbi:hypothetical protein F2Q69_00020294 [Brassica cretica]|uniref:Xylanase inhibitor C-terminal domain-containing protein n=1 Tax=Brassica cretica TaxID=69181 RepID=A0A8S9QRP7_BRACR|nr:hypothetical protein F2Q69_00020294 [Brassica cretica]